MQKIACITLVMNEIGQKIASKGELVHRVYLRHLIQEMNLCCRLFAKKKLFAKDTRQKSGDAA